MSLLEKRDTEKDTTVTRLRGKGFLFLTHIRALRLLRPTHMILNLVLASLQVISHHTPKTHE